MLHEADALSNPSHPGSLPPGCPRHHLDTGGVVLRNHQTEFALNRPRPRLRRKVTDDQGAVGLLDTVIPEGGAQSLPGRLCGSHEQDSRGVDVQAVDDTAAQAALSHTLEPRVLRHHGPQHGPGLILLQGMDRHPGGLVHRQPTRPRAQQHRAGTGGLALAQDSGLARDALLLANAEGLDLQLAADRQGQTLVAGAQAATVEADPAPGQQPAHLGARDSQSIRQEPIGSQPRLGGLDHQGPGPFRLHVFPTRVVHLPSLAPGRRDPGGRRSRRFGTFPGSPWRSTPPQQRPGVEIRARDPRGLRRSTA